MIKKKYLLLLPLFIFVSILIPNSSAIAATSHCKPSLISDITFDIKYKACVNSEITSGRFTSQSECDSILSPSLITKCKKAVEQKMKEEAGKNAPVKPSTPSTTPAATPSITPAATPSTSPSTTPANKSYVQSRCVYFLGLTSWDCNLNINNEESLKTGIWQIVANVAKDITVIAAYLVIGYVIYGGYLYIFSAGDPSKTASGKKTLTQAFIGLAIVMLANIIMDTIRFVLLGNGKLNCNPATGEGCIDSAGVSNLVNQAIQWFIGVGGTVSAIFVVLGGISLMTSNGDPGKVQKAKQTITYALIGLAIVGLSQIITAFVTNMIREAGEQSQFTNNTISTITKEQND